MSELSAEQKAAVESDAPSTVVIASPAVGKTTCLISRIRWLLDKGIDPKKIVAISFTNVATDEIRKRLGSVTIGYCGTLHSWMLRLIRETYPDASVMDEDSTEVLLTDLCYQMKYRGTKQALAELIALGLPMARDRKSVAGLVAHEFYQSMIRNQAFSYDALLVIGHSLISKWDWKFSHLHADEHQDAGQFDAAIYAKLQVQHKWFCGDPDQNLFSFRGSDVKHILNLVPSSAVFKLELNYRSYAAICSAANKLIAHNTQRIDKKSIPFSPEAGHVSVHRHSTSEEELVWLAQSIRDLQETGSKLSECAVLVRTNDLVGKISNGLKAFSIPVLERQQAQLPEDWQKAMLALSAFASPNNDFLMKRFLYAFMPCDTVGVVAEATRKFTTINRCYKHWPDNPLASWIPVAIGPLCLSTLSMGLIQDAIMGLPAGATASDLLVELRSHPPMISTGQTDGVYVGTVHSAKGREFDNVFLPAFEDEIIPGHREAEIEENRRVAFVAITRARHRLAFSFSDQREMPWKQGTQFHHPSRFIKECGVETQP